MKKPIIRTVQGMRIITWPQTDGGTHIEVCPFKDEDLHSVTIYQHASVTLWGRKKVDKAEVNWGTWGPETPRRARQFARAVRLASTMADEINAKMVVTT